MSDWEEAGQYPYENQPTGADGRYIRDRLMPAFWEHFASKAKDYNDIDGFEPHRVLGRRGQFGEIWRKVWKLKNTMWDDRTLIHEGEREILLDMIGHCFLAIAMLDGEKPPLGSLEDVPPEWADPRTIPVQVAGEDWQGPVKRRPSDPSTEKTGRVSWAEDGIGGPKDRTLTEAAEKALAEPDPMVVIRRPSGEQMEILRSQADRPWPSCGRERCVNCTKIPLGEFLEQSRDPIQYGRPSPGTTETEQGGVVHYDAKFSRDVDQKLEEEGGHGRP